jgi:hypothetical protein
MGIFFININRGDSLPTAGILGQHVTTLISEPHQAVRSVNQAIRAA